jgi:hypothetical protein
MGGEAVDEKYGWYRDADSDVWSARGELRGAMRQPGACAGDEGLEAVAVDVGEP